MEVESLYYQLHLKFCCHLMHFFALRISLIDLRDFPHQYRRISVSVKLSQLNVNTFMIPFSRWSLLVIFHRLNIRLFKYVAYLSSIIFLDFFKSIDVLLLSANLSMDIAFEYCI